MKEASLSFSFFFSFSLSLPFCFSPFFSAPLCVVVFLSQKRTIFSVCWSSLGEETMARFFVLQKLTSVQHEGGISFFLFHFSLFPFLSLFVSLLFFLLLCVLWCFLLFLSVSLSLSPFLSFSLSLFPLSLFLSFFSFLSFLFPFFPFFCFFSFLSFLSFPFLFFPFLSFPFLSFLFFLLSLFSFFFFLFSFSFPLPTLSPLFLFSLYLFSYSPPSFFFLRAYILPLLGLIHLMKICPVKRKLPHSPLTLPVILKVYEKERESGGGRERGGANTKIMWCGTLSHSLFSPQKNSNVFIFAEPSVEDLVASTSSNFLFTSQDFEASSNEPAPQPPLPLSPRAPPPCDEGKKKKKKRNSVCG